MTIQEYKIVCLLIDRNTQKIETNYCGMTSYRMNEQNINQLKQDLEVLIKEEQDD